MNNIMFALPFLCGCIATNIKPLSIKEQSSTVVKIQSKEKVFDGDYVITMMNVVGAQISPIKKQVIAQAIIRVSDSLFDNDEQKKQFVTLIAIESKFNTESRSSVGAVGLTQVMPKYAKEFAAKCGMADIQENDLKLMEINLIVGGCRFRALLETFNGLVSPALVAYNAGVNSDQLKQLKSLKNMVNVETSSYINKWFYVKEQVDQQLNSSPKER